MGRRPCCSKEGLKKGAWTALEDKILSHYINIHGEGKWRNLPKRAGLKRCGKSCRLRWLNYLRPDIKRGNISHDEEELIIRLHNLLGNRWSLIAGRLPGRTDNEIKNYWNTNLAKKIQQSESSSTTCRIPSNPIKKEAKHIKSSKSFNQLQSPKLANTTSSSVVRTKATRCTKVVNLQDQLEKNINNIEHDHGPIIFGTESKEANSIVNDEPKLGLMVSDYNHENTNGYSELSTMMNFESDDQEDFLSKFLDMDFLHFYSGIEGQSSPKSHDQDQSQPPLFNEDHNLYGEDLPSAPLIESGLLLDWLQD